MPEYPVVYLRDRFMPAPEAHLSIFDLGIVMGATVTDLLRTFRQQPYRLEDHARRFYQSCKYARIAPPVPMNETIQRTRELIARNAALLSPHEELGVIYFITPGENQLYAGSAAAAGPLKPTFCIHSFPLRFEIFRRVFTEGIHLVTPPTRHVPPVCVDSKIKNRSRLHFWLADQEAHLVDPCASALLLDIDGNLTETSGGNVLLVKDGAVLSPVPRNILLGVSRQIVIGLCGKLGIPFRERDLQVHDLLTADEAFVVTTPYCMAPVVRANGISVGDGTGFPIFEAILHAWSEDLGLDIRAQVIGA